MNTELFHSITQSIQKRWNIPEYVQIYPWIRPCTVRILIYTEGIIRFNGGPFLGLKHVIATLKADPWYWVKFDIKTAHRQNDSSANFQNKRLDELGILENYDQIWLFGIDSSSNILSNSELAVMTEFMDSRQGGVLVTGDHANLGQGLSAAIPRVGKMRRYPAPPAAPPTWNTTVEEGSDANTTFDFDDQSDDVPQKIRLRRYPLWSLISSQSSYRWAPHPVMCGLDGAIDVLPDHEHEGEAVVPSTLPETEWLVKDGHQERPQVIAWGKIKDPNTSDASGNPRSGQEIGVVSAYNGHRADVGRIVADSTWHHFFDINLLGVPGSTVYKGFPASAAGQKALKKIESYFLNIAVWLAPPNKQICMRNALSWGLIWRERFVELDVRQFNYSSLFLGEQALDALGQVAPRCTVRGWLFWDLLSPSLRLRLEKTLLESRLESQAAPALIEQFVVGTAFKTLLEKYGRDDEQRSIPTEMPAAEDFEGLFKDSVQQGLELTVGHYKQLAELSSQLLQVDLGGRIKSTVS